MLAAGGPKTWVRRTFLTPSPGGSPHWGIPPKGPGPNGSLSVHNYATPSITPLGPLRGLFCDFAANWAHALAGPRPACARSNRRPQAQTGDQPSKANLRAWACACGAPSSARRASKWLSGTSLFRTTNGKSRALPEHGPTPIGTIGMMNLTGKSRVAPYPAGLRNPTSTSSAALRNRSCVQPRAFGLLWMNSHSVENRAGRVKLR